MKKVYKKPAMQEMEVQPQRIICQSSTGVTGVESTDGFVFESAGLDDTADDM
jgi:hypothetical protein